MSTRMNLQSFGNGNWNEAWRIDCRDDDLFIRAINSANPKVYVESLNNRTGYWRAKLRLDRLIGFELFAVILEVIKETNSRPYVQKKSTRTGRWIDVWRVDCRHNEE